MSDRSGDLRFLHGSRQPACTAVMNKHFLGYRTLQFMERGCIALDFGANRHRLEGRWAWPHFPGPRIRLHSLTPSWFHRHIAVSGPLCESWAAEGLWPTAPQPIAESFDLGALLDECFSLFNDPTRSSQRRAINRLEDILLLLQAARGGSAEQPWLARARTLLADPDAFHADVADVGRACGMAASTFRRRFATAAGMSPQAYALSQRMARARDLLASTDLSMAAIAERLGYDDPAFFGKQFRRHAGSSPAAWRRKFA
jgi:AraC-like DNA-binding protein